MNKKKLLISGGILLVILLVAILIFASIKSKNNKVTEEIKFDTKVVSSLTMDINPSIKIELNKDNKVVNIYALNDDAKDVISSNYKEKSLDDVLKNITDNLVTKDYFKKDTTIIINVTGSIKSETVKELIVTEAKINDVNVNIIEPNITESGKKLAEKLGITEAKASYLEDVISKNPDVKIEDIKDKSVSEINNIVKEATNNENHTNKPNNETNKPSGETKPNGVGGLAKCDNIKSVLTNEEAGKKVASLRGATVETGSYCDILAPESVVALSPDGTCSYKVTISYRTNTCVYYVAMETGKVIGSPSCIHKDVTEGENQCIIMEDMGLTKREMFYYKGVDNGSEYVSTVEDVYGTPDENGQTYIYEYRVSKATGLITKKEKIDILR